MQQDRWKNRRAMAWISMIAGLAYPLLILYTESDQLGAVAGPFYMFVIGVVGSYIGFATFDDKWNTNRNNEENLKEVTTQSKSTSRKTINKKLENEGFPPEPK